MAEAIEHLGRPVKEGGVLGPGDVVVDGVQESQGALPRGATPRAWCPTPRARAAMARVGLELPGPSVEALIAANSRETFAALDPLPGALVVTSQGALRAAVERAGLPRSGGGVHGRAAWVLRRSLCSAGSGRLIAEAWGEPAERWSRAALAEGPVEVQPLVDIVDEYSVHGFVDEGGGVRCGEPLRWRGPAHEDEPGDEPGEQLRVVPPLSEAGYVRLVRSGAQVGEALVDLGYSGPFGVDAFRWRGADGAVSLQVATDINARLTFQFARGAPELLGALSS